MTQHTGAMAMNISINVQVETFAQAAALLEIVQRKIAAQDTAIPNAHSLVFFEGSTSFGDTQVEKFDACQVIVTELIHAPVPVTP